MNDSAQRAVEAVSEAYAKATPGEWQHEPSDDGDPSVGMNGHRASVWVHPPAFEGVVDDPIEIADMKWPVYRIEPTEAQIEAARQAGGDCETGFESGDMDSNAAFITLAHNSWPAIAAHIAALTAENARLREELKDTLLEAVGDLRDDERKQYDTMASRTNQAMLDRLVELGVLTRDPDGVGRRWFYRPAALPPAKGGE